MVPLGMNWVITFAKNLIVLTVAGAIVVVGLVYVVGFIMAMNFAHHFPRV